MGELVKNIEKSEIGKENEDESSRDYVVDPLNPEPRRDRPFSLYTIRLALVHILSYCG